MKKIQTIRKSITGLFISSLLLGGAGMTAVHAQSSGELEQLRQRIDALEKNREERFSLERDDQPRSGPWVHSLAGRPQAFDQRGAQIGVRNNLRRVFYTHSQCRPNNFPYQSNHKKYCQLLVRTRHHHSTPQTLKPLKHLPTFKPS